MMPPLPADGSSRERSVRGRFGNFFRNQASKIREINEKYAVPRVHTGRGVGIALLVLRVYLIVLLGLIAVKFITLLH